MDYGLDLDYDFNPFGPTDCMSLLYSYGYRPVHIVRSHLTCDMSNFHNKLKFLLFRSDNFTPGCIIS